MRIKPVFCLIVLCASLAVPGFLMLDLLMDPDRKPRDQDRNQEGEAQVLRLPGAVTAPGAPLRPGKTSDPDQNLDPVIATAVADQGLTLLSLSPALEKHMNCRDFRVEGSLGHLLSCVQALSGHENHSFLNLELRHETGTRYYLAGRYGQIKVDPLISGTTEMFEPYRLARLLGAENPPPTPIPSGTLAAHVPNPAKPQSIQVPGTEKLPGKGRFVLRGASGVGEEIAYLVKDLVLDRMIWIPGDQDWSLDENREGLMTLKNGSGLREEVRQ